MSIYLFKPTFLYIKQHSVTGKLYFGKTVQNPEKYCGSGVHWKNHIKKHGKEHVITLWYCLFLDQESCTDFALNFSEQHNIVESDDWLNCIPENGLGGSPKGRKCSLESKMKMSISKTGTTHSLSTLAKKSTALKGKPWSTARRIAQVNRQIASSSSEGSSSGISFTVPTKSYFCL